MDPLQLIGKGTDALVWASGNLVIRVSHHFSAEEAKIYATLSEKNVVPQLHAHVMDHRHVQLLQRIHGETLAKLFPRMNQAMAQRLGPRLLDKIRQMHTLNIIHQDLHMRNILIDSQTYEPWIIDLGHAAYLRNPEESNYQKRNDFLFLQREMEPYCQEEFNKYRDELIFSEIPHASTTLS